MSTQTLLGQYDFDVTASAPTTTISLVASLTDSAGTYGPGEGEHKQEFRRLPSNVVKAVEDAVKAAVTDASMTAVNMDLDLDSFQPWDNQLDRIFINAEIGYASDLWVLTRDIVGSVRQFRLSR